MRYNTKRHLEKRKNTTVLLTLALLLLLTVIITTATAVTTQTTRSTPPQTGNYDDTARNSSPPTEISWARTYGGTGYDDAYSGQQTADGGYIVAGETDSFGAGDTDVWVFKPDSNGSVAWNGDSGASTLIATVTPSDSNAMVSATSVASADSASMVQDTNVTPMETSAIVRVEAGGSDSGTIDGSHGASSGAPWIVVAVVGVLFLVCLVIMGVGRLSRESTGIAREAIPEPAAELETGSDRSEPDEPVEPADMHEHVVPKPFSGACPYCGKPSMRLGALFCWNCGASLSTSFESGVAGGQKKKSVKTVGKCMVCNLEVESDDATLWCPYCGNMAHKTHMLEWLHVKDYCPACRRHLEESALKDQRTKRAPKKHRSHKRRSK